MRCAVLVLLAMAGVAHADPSPAALAPATAPAVANRSPSNVAWITLVPGHGPRPGPTDWVTVYGARSREDREQYYLARPERVNNVEPYLDLADLTVGEKRRYWIPAGVWGPTAFVRDVELAAILGPTAPTGLPQFPPPSDALRGAGGQRYLDVRTLKAGGNRADLTDRVFFDVVAMDRDGKHLDLGTNVGTITLADVQVPEVVTAIRGMADGGLRYVWTTIAGSPVWLRITLYSVEKRAQVRPPFDVTRVPAAATHLPDVDFVVVTAGSGEPPDEADEITFDLTVWTSSGRTVARRAGSQLARDFIPALTAQLTTMRAGEHRRIWLSPTAASYLSEGGVGAVADLTLSAIRRNIEPLPDGLAIVRAGRHLEVTRGGVRAPLGVSVVRLDRLTLTAGVVTLTGDDSCDIAATAAIPLAHLQAKLERVAAQQLFAAGRYADAITGLARAVALAPEVDVLHAELAIAHVRAGQLREAAHVLALGAAANPVWIASRLLDDPELAAVAKEPELAKLRGRRRGRVDLATMPVMIDASGRHLAMSVHEWNWPESGAGAEAGGQTRIEVVELATGATVATIPRVAWTSASDEPPPIAADLARRKRQVEAMLAELGFARPKRLEAATLATDSDGQGSVAIFKRAGLVVDRSGVVRRAKLLAPVTGVTGEMRAAYWLPGGRVVVIAHWGYQSHGCGGDPPGIVVVKVP